MNNKFNLTPKPISASDTAAVNIEGLGKTVVLEQIPIKRHLYKLNLELGQNTLVLETNGEQSYIANFYVNSGEDSLRFDLKVDSAVDESIRYYRNRITDRVLGVDIPPLSCVYVKSPDNIIIPGLFVTLSPTYTPYSIELIV